MIDNIELNEIKIKCELNAEGNGYIITDLLSPKNSDVILPDKYNGLPIVAIDINDIWANTRHRRCKSLKIGKYVELLTSYSDYNIFTRLENLYIPASLYYIKDSIFKRHKPLHIEVDKANEYFKVIDGALVNIKEGKLIYSSTGKIPCNPYIKYIDKFALNNITGTGNEIFIPDNIEEISSEIFDSYPHLFSDFFRVSESNPNFYIKDNCLINRKTKTLVRAFFEDYKEPYHLDLSSFDIYHIGPDAIAGHRNLVGITFPQSLMTIGDRAFATTGIEKFIFPDSISYLGYKLFEGCPFIKEIKFPRYLINMFSSFNCDNSKWISDTKKLRKITYPLYFNSKKNRLILTKNVTYPLDFKDDKSEMFLVKKNYKTIHVPSNLIQVTIDEDNYGGSIDKLVFDGIPLNITIGPADININDIVFLKKQNIFQYKDNVLITKTGGDLIYIKIDEDIENYTLPSYVKEISDSFGSYISDSIKKLIIHHKMANLKIPLLRGRFGGLNEVDLDYIPEFISDTPPWDNLVRKVYPCKINIKQKYTKRYVIINGILVDKERKQVEAILDYENFTMFENEDYDEYVTHKAYLKMPKKGKNVFIGENFKIWGITRGTTIANLILNRSYNVIFGKKCLHTKFYKNAILDLTNNEFYCKYPFEFPLDVEIKMNNMINFKDYDNKTLIIPNNVKEISSNLIELVRDRKVNVSLSDDNPSYALIDNKIFRKTEEQ